MVISNLTGIEQWILEKAKWRRKDILKTDDEYIFPYDLGWERDLLQLNFQYATLAIFENLNHSFIDKDRNE